MGFGAIGPVAARCRVVGVPDLLVAVAAEVHRVPVLHYDDDFHRVAAITGQPVEWVVGRGAVT
ncbi:MAG: hypothetical protein ACT4O0_21210 [Pseudonocardia sp.]